MEHHVIIQGLFANCSAQQVTRITFVVFVYDMFYLLSQ